ncbi:MAG: galactokinase [Rhodothermaceae bacterium]
MELVRDKLINLYGSEVEVIKNQEKRFARLALNFRESFSTDPKYFFSAPGRTEIAGNHTDHNHGKVIAAGINLDTIAAVSLSDDEIVTIYSEGFNKGWKVNINETEPVEKEKETTAALIRGIAARFNELGFSIGGFNACISSDVMIGSGLSSSASFEVLIGEIFNSLFNENKIDPVEIAKAGQYAENKYFGKPCGLMDQVACAVGGIVKIDFNNPANPVVEKIDLTFGEYSLLIVDTGGNHADLTNDYAAIPTEMKNIAKEFNTDVCRNIDQKTFWEKLNELREKEGDRSVLRAIHFFSENERVDQMIKELAAGSFEEFLNLVKKSGNSSFKYLQNCYSPENVKHQGIVLALLLTEKYLQANPDGVCRVHGGGFAGTIQVILKKELVENYIRFIEPIFGKGSVLNLNIRSTGVIQL